MTHLIGHRRFTIEKSRKIMKYIVKFMFPSMMKLSFVFNSTWISLFICVYMKAASKGMISFWFSHTIRAVIIVQIGPSLT